MTAANVAAQPLVTLDLNTALAAKAAEIRESARADGRSVRTPYSVFLATALAYRAEALHTFDYRLLSLNGLTHVEGLAITRPRGTQQFCPCSRRWTVYNGANGSANKGGCRPRLL